MIVAGSSYIEKLIYFELITKHLQDNLIRLQSLANNLQLFAISLIFARLKT